MSSTITDSATKCSSSGSGSKKLHSKPTTTITNNTKVTCNTINSNPPAPPKLSFKKVLPSTSSSSSSSSAAVVPKATTVVVATGTTSTRTTSANNKRSKQKSSSSSIEPIIEKTTNIVGENTCSINHGKKLKVGKRTVTKTATTSSTKRKRKSNTATHGKRQKVPPPFPSFSLHSMTSIHEEKSHSVTEDKSNNNNNNNNNNNDDDDYNVTTAIVKKDQHYLTMLTKNDASLKELLLSSDEEEEGEENNEKKEKDNISSECSTDINTKKEQDITIISQIKSKHLDINDDDDDDDDDDQNFEQIMNKLNKDAIDMKKKKKKSHKTNNIIDNILLVHTPLPIQSHEKQNQKQLKEQVNVNYEIISTNPSTNVMNTTSTADNNYTANEMSVCCDSRLRKNQHSVSNIISTANSKGTHQTTYHSNNRSNENNEIIQIPLGIISNENMNDNYNHSNYNNDKNPPTSYISNSKKLQTHQNDTSSHRTTSIRQDVTETKVIAKVNDDDNNNHVNNYNNSHIQRVITATCHSNTSKSHNHIHRTKSNESNHNNDHHVSSSNTTESNLKIDNGNHNQQHIISNDVQLLLEAEEQIKQEYEHWMKQAKAPSNTCSRKKSKQQQQPHEPCIFCTHCSCTRNNIALAIIEQNALKEEMNPLYQRAMTDIAKEVLLIKRIGRLEHITSHFDSLHKNATSELNEFRKTVNAKKMEEGGKSRKYKQKKSWFLHDYHEDSICNEEVLYSSIKTPKRIVERAMNNMFAFRRKRQPTLTQMLGDSSNNNDDNDEQNNYSQEELNNKDLSIIDETRESDIEESEDIDEDDNNSNKLEKLKSQEEEEEEEEEEEGRDEASILNNQYSLCSEEDKRILHSEMYLDYELALSKGKERGLWDLASANKTMFDSVHHPSCEELMPLEESDFRNNNKKNIGLSYRASSSNGDWYHSDLIEILNVNENDEMKILIDILQETTSFSCDNGSEGDRKEEEDDGTNFALKKNSNYNHDHEVSDRVTLSQFSPCTKDAISKMKSKIRTTTNIETMNSVQSLFPNWEENIHYIFQQQQDDCQYALNQILQKRANVARVKEMLLRKVNAMDSALGLFETVLKNSVTLHEERKDRMKDSKLEDIMNE